jgi:hypothetical protein
MVHLTSSATSAAPPIPLQLPVRSKPTEIVVQGVDYDPEDTYSSSSSSTAADAAADTSSDSGSDDAAEQQPWHERFPQLHAAIEAAIQQLDGQVAPRLNWSSPTDALWISAYNSLKCCNADQVGTDRAVRLCVSLLVWWAALGYMQASASAAAYPKLPTHGFPLSWQLSTAYACVSIAAVAGHPAAEEL